MLRLPTRPALLPLLPAILLLSRPLLAAPVGAAMPAETSPPAAGWSSAAAQHVVGLPGATAKEKGTLQITASGLRFTGKATGSTTIPIQSILAVGAGNERVELWGMKGRLLRMAIPDGGGLLAAAFMHHRVDMLTVEYSDSASAYQRRRLLSSGRRRAACPPRPCDFHVCLPPRSHHRLVQPASLRPAACGFRLPTGARRNVPPPHAPSSPGPHLVERLAKSPGIDHVYRDGEVDPLSRCASSTVRLSVTGFKAGNQSIPHIPWVRPECSPPQPRWSSILKIADAAGRPMLRDQVKATVRGESESTGVANSVAKKVARQFAAAQKQSGRRPGGAD